MPIYEFYCPDCNTLFNFFSRTINTTKKPKCPRCKTRTLERQMSAFAFTGKAKESDDGEDGFGQGQGDAVEHLDFGGAVDEAGFEELLGERVEEAFEQEDGVAVGEAGQYQGPVGIEQAEVFEEQEVGDLGDGHGEGHGSQEEEQDAICIGELEAGQGVGTKRVYGEGGEDHGGAQDDGIDEGAPEDAAE